MPSQLYENDNVSFICGRNFTYNGKDYKAGADFPQEDLVSNVETMVRTRFLIPVVDDMSDKPRHWHREIQQRDIVLEKLGIVQTVDDPSEHTVAEVLEFAEANPGEAEELLELEEEGKERVTLIEGLEEIASQFHPGEHNVPEVLAYLESDITPEEHERVIQEERDGKARKGILTDEDQSNG